MADNPRVPRGPVVKGRWIMARPTGGTNVRAGFYWNLRKWEMTSIPRPGGILPGDAGETYVRVPVLALLVVAPLMGALYVIFLPFIGVAMVLAHLGRLAGAAARAGFMEVAVVVSPSWAPGEAYLAGKRSRREGRRRRKDTAGTGAGD